MDTSTKRKNNNRLDKWNLNKYKRKKEEQYGK